MAKDSEVVRTEPLPPDEVNQETPPDLEPLESMRLAQVQLLAPEGMPMEQWIFPALEAAGGLIIVTDGGKDPRWKPIYASGLPQDMRRVDVCFSAAAFHSSYKDFAIHGKGVIADPTQPEKGKGAWRWKLTDHETGQEFIAHLWFEEVFLRNSTTQLIGHYNPDTNRRYSELTGFGKGVRFELMDFRLDDTESAHLLIDRAVLLSDAQNILDAAVAEKRGRKKLAEVAPETLKLWSAEYDEATAALEKQASNRKWKQLARITDGAAKEAFVKLALPGLPRDVAVRLARCTRISELALRYAAWRCSKIEIGVGATRTLQNLLQKSDKVNDRKRSTRK